MRGRVWQDRQARLMELNQLREQGLVPESVYAEKMEQILQDL